MCEQNNKENLNFQHGDTYLSPSLYTAAEYAVNKRYGSELLTYCIDFLNELLAMKIDYVQKDLFKKYKNVFGFIRATPSPLLLEIQNVPAADLLDEFGNSPQDNFEQIQQILDQGSDHESVLIQQINFRLTKPIPIEKLQVWLINVMYNNNNINEYNFYSINTSKAI
jgi:hypothetical protein